MSWFTGPSITLPIYRAKKPRDHAKARKARQARAENARNRSEMVGAINRAQRSGPEAARGAEQTYAASLRALLDARKKKGTR